MNNCNFSKNNKDEIMKKNHLLLIIGFIVLYSLFIFGVNINLSLDFASQLTVAATFFFAIFSGFFITRQNERYTRIIEVISERDGIFSFLYRAFGLVPRIQSEMREIIKNHYTKILESNDWAYNEFHPSTTITDLTNVMGSVTDKEAKKLANNNLFDGIWVTIEELQKNRKKIIAAYKERLLLFQWILIYLFAGITILSFHFLQTEIFWVNILKIVFGTAVFLVVILIKQLNDLSLFGKNFSHNIAGDVLRVVNEVDAKEVEENK